MCDQASASSVHESKERYAARHRLCSALSRDFADSLLVDSLGAARLAEILNTEFQGFATFSDIELIEAVFEAGLEERNAADIHKLFE